MVCTYEMTLSDLDHELRDVLTSQRVSVVKDERRNFAGLLTMMLRDGETLINCHMDVCREESMFGAAGADGAVGIGGSALLRRPGASLAARFCQLRMWVDFF